MAKLLPQFLNIAVGITDPVSLWETDNKILDNLQQ